MFRLVIQTPFSKINRFKLEKIYASFFLLESSPPFFNILPTATNGDFFGRAKALRYM